MASLPLAIGGRQENVLQVTIDGRLALWNVNKGELRLTVQEREHLRIRYTAIAVGVWKQPTSARKGSRKAKDNADFGERILAATGDADGRVSIWDLSNQTLLCSGLKLAGSSSSGEVSSVCFSPDCKAVYACGPGSQYVGEYAIDVGQGEAETSNGILLRRFKVGKQGAQRVSVSPNGKLLLAGSRTLKLFDLASAERIKRFTGHATAVRGISFAPDSSHFLSCSEDRFVSLWECGAQQGAGAQVQVAPTQVFAAPSPASWINLAAHGASRLLVSVCCDNGSACFWSADPENNRRENNVRPDCVVQTSDAAAVLVPPAFSSGRDQDSDHVIIARKQALRPFFDRVQICDKDGTLKSSPATRDLSQNDRLLSNGGILDSAQQERTEVSGDSQEQMSSTAKKQKLHIVKGKGAGAPTPSLLVDVGNELVGDDDNGELTGEMQSRIRTLTEALDKQIKSQIKGSKVNFSKKRRREEIVDFGDSVATCEQALEDALQQFPRGGKDLFNVCFRFPHEGVMKASVQRLSSLRARQFLQLITTGFASRQIGAVEPLSWAREILDQHAAELAKASDIDPSLSTLYKIVQNRQHLLSKLLKLQGRLEFVITQVKLGKKAKRAIAKAQSVNGKSTTVAMASAGDDIESEKEKGTEKAVVADADGSARKTTSKQQSEPSESPKKRRRKQDAQANGNGTPKKKESSAVKPKRKTRQSKK